MRNMNLNVDRANLSACPSTTFATRFDIVLTTRTRRIAEPRRLLLCS